MKKARLIRHTLGLFKRLYLQRNILFVKRKTSYLSQNTAWFCNQINVKVCTRRTDDAADQEHGPGILPIKMAIHRTDKTEPLDMFISK